MPDAVRVQVANAVVAALAAASDDGQFSLEISPVRSNASVFTRLADDNAELRVDVVPVNRGKMKLATRGATEFTVYTDILVRKRCQRVAGIVPDSETDPLAKLIEEMQEFFLKEPNRLLAGLTNLAASTETEPQQETVPKHLTDWGQFTAWWRLTFTCTRDQ